MISIDRYVRISIKSSILFRFKFCILTIKDKCIRGIILYLITKNYTMTPTSRYLSKSYQQISCNPTSRSIKCCNVLTLGSNSDSIYDCTIESFRTCFIRSQNYIILPIIPVMISSNNDRILPLVIILGSSKYY